MTTETMTGTDLLKMDEENFHKVVKEMTIKDLMETITDLQKEMAREQENFNSLSSELQNIKDRNSRQYKQISKDLVTSQQHLSLLMNRSMKCFAQQNLHNSSDSTLKRRNSAKGSKPVTTPASVYANLQRSKSLLAVNNIAATDLTSNFQPTRPHLADSSTSEYSMDTPHMPVIMRTSANGGVKVTTTINNVHYNPKHQTGETDAVGYCKETASPSISSSRESKTVVTGHTGSVNKSGDIKMTGPDDFSSSASSTGGAGLYLKRKTAQQPRVITTTNISSSKFLPLSQPLSSPPASEPTTATLYSAASSTHASMSRPPTLTTISSSANDPQVIKSKPVAYQTEYSSPLQMAQARKGVSKSQTFLQDGNTNEFRGLPSVKLLAQTFGSNTALNTIPRSGSGYSNSYHSRFVNTNTVYRSNSSLNLSDPQSATVAPQFNPKGSGQTSQPEPAVLINERPQQMTTKQLNRVPQSSAPSRNVNSEYEFERTRTKLRSVGREITGGIANGSVHSTGVVPITTQASMSDRNHEGEISDEKVIENNRIGAYVKRKDAVQGRPLNSVPLTSVTVKSINSSSSSIPSTITSTSVLGTALPQNHTSSQQVSSSLHNFTVDNSKTTSALKTPQGSAPTSVQTAPVSFVQKQQTSASTFSSGSRDNTSSSHKEFGLRKPVISTPAVTIRRTKSREELQEIENNSRVNKNLVLQQIQARRRDHETDGNESNFKTMSNMSRSMPSLLGDDIDGFSGGGDGSKTSPIKSSIVLSAKEKNVAADNGAFVDDGIELEDEDKIARMNLRDWKPNPLLSELYEVKLAEEVVEDISHQFITMEGLMEKLPMNKRKATLLKTWKRRYFRAKDGWLYYYESSNMDQPSESIQLMGGMIHDLGTRVLGIDDGRGRFLMVRCPTEKEYGQWKVALESQTADNTKATYVRPVLRSPKHSTKNVVIIDLGSSAIRAGILGQQASLPELFFPSLVALDKDSGKVVAVGQDALLPNFRHKCKIVQPIRPSNKVDQFNIEVHLMRAIFDKIFHDLNVNPADYWLMISTPQNLGNQLKKSLMEVLVITLKVKGVCMVQQALLALYSYNATSGIIVDIGHRIEILPIFEGFVIEGGVARCPYGAQKVQESLTTSLLRNNYKFMSTTEQLLVRYIMEKVCYVAMDYSLEVEWCKSQPQTTKRYVKFNKFSLPDGAYESVECDIDRFKSPEGFFNADLWEMDYPTLQKLVFQAIQTCPIDNRRHVWRAVFLSGGVTMLPGFADRLEKELRTLAPSGVPVEVHAAPQRYHAAFIGACSVALMPQFEEMAISREEWKKDGIKAFRKWQAPSS